jgi:hypothetical protein
MVPKDKKIFGTSNRWMYCFSENMAEIVEGQAQCNLQKPKYEMEASSPQYLRDPNRKICVV